MRASILTLAVLLVAALLGLPAPARAARDFSGSTTDFLSTTDRPVTAYPFYGSAWIKCDTTTAAMVVVWLGQAAGADDLTDSQYVMVNADNTVSLVSTTTEGAAMSTTTATVTDGVWANLTWRNNSSTARQIALNGTVATNNNTARLFGTTNLFSIGSRQDLVPDSPFDGAIERVAIKASGVALNITGPYATSGYNFYLGPSRLGNVLSAYWPLIGAGLENSWAGAGGTLVESGSCPNAAGVALRGGR